ncbi:MAG: DUF899 domain-containing protein [Fimbriimonadaceae bacterium]|nr:DUF899 domain-containing protein [Fimbriimonadaceae bacterium]
MQTETIAHPKVVSREEWLAERKRLLEEEKELTRHKDRVNALRRRLPMVKIEKEYVFDTSEGKKTLLDLFEGRRQLIVYHFMFDPEWEEGCPGCTSYVAEIGDQSHLAKRDTTFTLISRAPLEKLESFKQKKGWKVSWASSFGSDFNYDFHTTIDESKAPLEYNYRTKAEWEALGKDTSRMAGEEHGTSVFFRIGDDVYHAYSNYGRGTEGTTDTYGLLDLTPYGRQEDFEDSPEGWPQSPTYG